MRRRNRGSRPESPRGLGRAIRYLGRYRRTAGIAYGALIVATLAQLMVPQLVQNIIDAVANGVLATRVLELPAQAQTFAAEQLGQTVEEITQTSEAAVTALIWAGVLIVVFALVRGLTAFSSAYMGEKAS
ncbi:MAG: ABC transporter ATP-binding protein, partial [Anaerolineales bacterium]|nr:ABC transporter ATP-binding protein [Anaerolineales bacterium]